MYLDGVVEARLRGETVLASLQRLDVPATPDNYSLWYEYHSGTSPDLQRTIDVLLSNNAGFDERTLEDLYSNFFSSAKEERAVREATSQVLETLHEVVALADGARIDARQFGAALSGLASDDVEKSLETLAQTIERLVSESQRMAGRSEYVGIRMRESANKIETLERNLESALLDATVDGLTGVANRKSFDSSIRKLAGDAMNSGEDLALLMVDIDHFKNVNDTWGHQVGDRVLSYVATILQRAVRGGDSVARYGGEEFAILLPRADVASALTVGENIRQALAREPFLLDTPGMGPITVSIGAACYEPGDPLAEWVGRTDSALYCAKREGRDCVQSA